jgi:four helix bundle protein
MGVESYRDLRVWRTAVELTLEVYQITQTFPRAEQFALTSQLRRAAVSVASNIAEGHARSSRGEYLNSLSAARGSAIEVEVQLFLAEQLGYVNATRLIKARDHCDAISRMITNLKRALAVGGKREAGRREAVRGKRKAVVRDEGNGKREARQTQTDN